MDFKKIYILKELKIFNFMKIYFLNNFKRILFFLFIILAVLSFTFFWINRTNYSILYKNLPYRDGYWILRKLKKMHVPYYFDRKTGSLLVSSDRIHELRFKLFKNNVFYKKNNITESLQSKNLDIFPINKKIDNHEILEKKLSDTLKCIFPIRKVRIHLVLPKENNFFKKKQFSSAAVILLLYPHMKLEKNQIYSISKIILHSIPNLSLHNISIIDQDGNWLNAFLFQHHHVFYKSIQDFQSDMQQIYRDYVSNMLSVVLGSKNFVLHLSINVEDKHNNKDNKLKQTKKSRSIKNRQSQSFALNKSDSFDFNNKNIASFFVSREFKLLGNQFLLSNFIQYNPELHNKNFIQKSLNINNLSLLPDRNTNQFFIKNFSITLLINYKKNQKNHFVPLSPLEIKNLTHLIKSIIHFSQKNGDSIKIFNYNFYHKFKKSNVKINFFYKKLISFYQHHFVLCSNIFMFFFIFLFFFVIFLIIYKKKYNKKITNIDVFKNKDKDSLNLNINKKFSKNINNISSASEEKYALKKDFSTQNPKIIAEIIRNWICKK